MHRGAGCGPGPGASGARTLASWAAVEACHAHCPLPLLSTLCPTRLCDPPPFTPAGAFDRRRRFSCAAPREFCSRNGWIGPPSTLSHHVLRLRPHDRCPPHRCPQGGRRPARRARRAHAGQGARSLLAGVAGGGRRAASAPRVAQARQCHRGVPPPRALGPRADPSSSVQGGEEGGKTFGNDIVGCAVAQSSSSPRGGRLEG